MWIFYATGMTIMRSFAWVFGSGLVVYLIKARANQEFPFHARSTTHKT
jgi:uncharacterized MAPEG superfamily protein